MQEPNFERCADCAYREEMTIRGQARLCLDCQRRLLAARKASA